MLEASRRLRSVVRPDDVAAEIFLCEDAPSECRTDNARGALKLGRIVDGARGGSPEVFGACLCGAVLRHGKEPLCC